MADSLSDREVLEKWNDVLKLMSFIHKINPIQTGHGPMPPEVHDSNGRLILPECCKPQINEFSTNGIYTNVLKDGKWTKELKKDRPIGR